MKRNNKKGFTIVELVIVIAVIAILSSVLIPTFGGITKKAQDSARDQKAKTAHTAYLVHTNANAGDFVIEVDGHFYAINDAQFNPDADTYTSAEAAAAATGDYDTATEVTGVEDVPNDVKVYSVSKAPVTPSTPAEGEGEGD